MLDPDLELPGVLLHHLGVDPGLVSTVPWVLATAQPVSIEQFDLLAISKRSTQVSEQFRVNFVKHLLTS